MISQLEDMKRSYESTKTSLTIHTLHRRSLIQVLTRLNAAKIWYGRWHEAWGGKVRVSNVLQPFERSARQLCLHYFSACGEIPGLKVFVTASGTVEQDTCSIIVDCRLKSPDKVEKIYSFFNKTRLRHWWVCLLQTKKHHVQSPTIHMGRPTHVLHFLATYNTRVSVQGD